MLNQKHLSSRVRKITLKLTKDKDNETIKFTTTGKRIRK